MSAKPAMSPDRIAGIRLTREAIERNEDLRTLMLELAQPLGNSRRHAERFNGAVGELVLAYQALRSAKVSMPAFAESAKAFLPLGPERMVLALNVDFEAWRFEEAFTKIVQLCGAVQPFCSQISYPVAAAPAFAEQKPFTPSKSAPVEVRIVAMPDKVSTQEVQRDQNDEITRTITTTTTKPSATMP